MDLTGYIGAGVVACAAFCVLSKVTKVFMEWKKPAWLIFAVLFVLQGTVSFYGVYHNRALQAGWLVLFLLMAGLLVIGQQRNHIKNAMDYLTVLFLFRMFFLLGRLFFVSIYSGFQTEKVQVILGTGNVWMVIYSLLLCIPAIWLLDFTWKSMQYLSGTMHRIFSVFSVLLLIVVEWFDAWIQMILIMPVGLLLISSVIIYRLYKEKRLEKELYYHRELETELYKKDREMEKLRKEVEKYYLLAGDDAKEYPGQVLKHIDGVSAAGEDNTSGRGKIPEGEKTPEGGTI